MKKNKLSTRILLIGGILLSMILPSCKAPQDVAYFQDVDTNVTNITNAQNAIKVRPEDKISILVSSTDPELGRLFNLTVNQTRVGNSTTRRENNNVAGSMTSQESQTSYTVSPEGTIDFPVLGTLQIAGMTRSELAGFIKGQLEGRGLLQNPVVIVEFLNTGISVLGEVRSPGRYNYNRDHLTILDALAMAGDLDIQGQRQNVLVIREENGKRNTYRIDLTKGSQFMNSPAYYLQQEDIVYVEPNNVKKRQTTVNGNNVLSAPFWVSVASLLTSIAVLIFK
ncbi:MAG: polysaccharide biosynthesis/export family protein [Muribaculaceae bacterium]|nr:polysaccharide biosynthesis/export family protein [Muribaculaceae bacterium]